MPVWQPVFPREQDLTEEKLAAAEQAENALKELGFSDFRVRVWHGAARLQFPEKQWLAAAGRRQEIRDVLKPFFQTVYSGFGGSIEINGTERIDSPASDGSRRGCVQSMMR